jgi:hypothetical protein
LGEGGNVPLARMRSKILDMISTKRAYLVEGDILTMFDLHNPAIGEPVWSVLHTFFLVLLDIHSLSL